VLLKPALASAVVGRVFALPPPLPEGRPGRRQVRANLVAWFVFLEARSVREVTLAPGAACHEVSGHGPQAARSAPVGAAPVGPSQSVAAQSVAASRAARR